MNQITKDPDYNIFTGGLNMDDKDKVVLDKTGNYGMFPWLASLIDAKPKEAVNRPEDRVHGWYGVFYKPIITNDAITGVVSVAPTVNNQNQLVVTFTDNTLNIFRVSDTVTDGTLAQNMGTVVSATAGQIVLQVAPVTGGAPIVWNTSTMFQPGAIVTALFGSSGLGDSQPRENLNQTPIYIKYNTAVARDNQSIQTFLDTGQTWMDAPVQGIKDTKLWFYMYQMQMKKRILKQEDFRAYFSKQGQITNSAIPGGMINYSRGWRDSVMASDGSGGIYRPITSALTQPVLEEFLNAIADRRANGSNTPLTLLMGRGALRQIQNFIAPFVQYPGLENTFGGKSVKGIDVKRFSVAGIDCEFIMPPFLNNPYDLSTPSSTNANFRLLQNTIMAINLDASPRSYVSMNPTPFIEKRYYGPVCDCDYIRPGVYGSRGSKSGISMEGFNTAMGMLDNAGIAINEIPRDSVGWISNCCYTFDTYDCGLLEQY